MSLRRGILSAVTAAVLIATGVHAGEHKLVNRWKAPQAKGKQFKKLLVIGITSDLEVRKAFENKFVSHLRA